MRIFAQGIGKVKKADAGTNGLAFGLGCQELLMFQFIFRTDKVCPQILRFNLHTAFRAIAPLIPH